MLSASIWVMQDVCVCHSFDEDWGRSAHSDTLTQLNLNQMWTSGLTTQNGDSVPACVIWFALFFLYGQSLTTEI